MKRIVVVLDGTPETEAVLPEAVKRARATGAAVRLLQVLRPGLGLHLSADREDEREANLYLETVAEGLRSHGVRVDCRVRRGPYLST
ncbi:MAG: universal stress protein, partial [Chloroflexi bacterium]|nr:universal stress protein [Chloroflexota bacterium]